MTLSFDMTEQEILDHLEDICATEDFRDLPGAAAFSGMSLGKLLPAGPTASKPMQSRCLFWGVTRISIRRLIR